MRSEDRWLGIDFSGNAKKWGPSVSKSNVWVAEVVRHVEGYRLVNLEPVQRLRGTGHPFTRLAKMLAAGDFRAAAIDAPLSVPAPCVPDAGHQALLSLVDGLLTNKRPFPTGADLLDVLTPHPGGVMKPLRMCERHWTDRGVNVRSTLWNGGRPGAPFTAAALKLLALAQRPVWPFAPGTENGLIVEAFPAAQLAEWRVRAPGYSEPDGLVARRVVIEGLSDRLELGTWRDTLEQSPDAIDATIAAFAAIAVTEGRVAIPPAGVARVEGWIAVHDDRPTTVLSLSGVDRPLVPADIPSQMATIEEITEFAHTFDGYEEAGSLDAPAELSSRRFQFTIEELRAILFLEHRRWRHMGEEPDAEATAYIRWLIEAIRQRVEQPALYRK